MQKACGIICEYNPFHNGHKYQIEYAKNVSGMPVVCAMSGNFVQRGEGACTDKKARGEAAVKAGAELVLEIPFPYSCMTAEKFARAGVTALSGSGMCSHLLFGSETADVEKLKDIATLLAHKETDECIRLYQSKNKNVSFAAARSIFVKEKLGDEASDILSNPNDILGIEYIKAIIETNSPLVPVALKRSVDRSEGASGEFASSSHIRQLIFDGETEKAARFVPEYSDLSEISDNSDFKRLIHLSIMAQKPESLRDICEISPGLEYAVIKAARASSSYDETVERLKSKTLTEAKVRRMLLFAFFGVGKEFMTRDLPYAYLLSSSDSPTARELLKTCRREKSIIIAQRVSALKKDDFCVRVHELAQNAEKVLRLSSKNV